MSLTWLPASGARLVTGLRRKAELGMILIDEEAPRGEEFGPRHMSIATRWHPRPIEPQQGVAIHPGLASEDPLSKLCG